MDSWLERFARTNFERSADTAHDLKTPLNVAVLNLELLRIRAATFTEGEVDEKIAGYAAAVEAELRRMASILDAFFLLSTPPREEGPPAVLDLSPLCGEAAGSAGMEIHFAGRAPVLGHPSRMRQALELFFGGASRLLKPEGRAVSAECVEGSFRVTVSGKPQRTDFEPTKIFKFYYTDPSGNPDLSLATARLIVETYGGDLKATEERDKVIICLSLPQEMDETSSNR